MAMYYEYVCNNCKVVTASIHGMNEIFDQKCKYCGEKDWQQIIFPPAIQFKGKGFYCNDYPKEKKL